MSRGNKSVASANTGTVFGTAIPGALMTEDLTKHCCFCFELTDVFRLDTFDDGAQHDG